MTPTPLENALFLQALIALATRRDLVLGRDVDKMQERLLREMRSRVRA